jgi:hypothetical protein
MLQSEVYARALRASLKVKRAEGGCNSVRVYNFRTTLSGLWQLFCQQPREGISDRFCAILKSLRRQPSRSAFHLLYSEEV